MENAIVMIRYLSASRRVPPRLMPYRIRRHINRSETKTDRIDQSNCVEQGAIII